MHDSNCWNCSSFSVLGKPFLFRENLSSAHKFSWFPSYVSCPSSFLEKYPMFSSLHIFILLFLFLYLLLENYLPHHSLHDTFFVKDLELYPLSPIISLGSFVKWKLVEGIGDMNLTCAALSLTWSPPELKGFSWLPSVLAKGLSYFPRYLLLLSCMHELILIPSHQLSPAPTSITEYRLHEIRHHQPPFSFSFSTRTIRDNTELTLS